VNTDRAELSLVWRGSFDATGLHEQSTVLVAYEPIGTRWNADELRARLARATPGRAVTLDQVLAAERPVIPSAPAPAEAPTPDITATLIGATRPSGLALPFKTPLGTMSSAPWAFAPPAPARSSPMAPASSAPENVESTLTLGVRRPPAPALPFLPRGASGVGGSDEVRIELSRPGSALPFIAPGTVAQTVSVAPEAVEEAPAPSLVALEPERIEEADETDPPPPRRLAAPSPPLLSVEDYVSIRAEMVTRRRKDVLSQRGISAATWKRQEQMQLEALEEEALAGKADRAVALAAALERVGLA
jgi:hypothetical protein